MRGLRPPGRRSRLPQPFREAANRLAAPARPPVPLLEAYAVRTLVSALRRLPRGVTVLPDDIAQAVAQDGAGEVLPQALPWSLPPVGRAWLKGSPKEAVITGLRDAILEGLVSLSLGPAWVARAASGMFEARD